MKNTLPPYSKGHHPLDFNISNLKANVSPYHPNSYAETRARPGPSIHCCLVNHDPFTEKTVILSNLSLTMMKTATFRYVFNCLGLQNL